MSVLYVTDPDAYLRKNGEQIEIWRSGRVVNAVYGYQLKQVLVFGRAQLSPAVRSFLLDEGIDTVFLTMGGRLRGRLVAAEGRNIDLRRAQFRHLEDGAFAIELARRIVSGKLLNCRTVLRRHHRVSPSDAVESAMHRIRYAAGQLDTAKTLDEVRGLEGAAAAAYFGCFGDLVKAKGFPFGGRSRRPPKDALNALLSFGYMMLLGTITAAVQVVGLDVYLGCLHAPDNGKPSLALDLMEEFRPLLVDATVLRVVNRGQIVPDDFEYRTGMELPDALGGDEDEAPSRESYPVLLKRESVRKWIAIYEATLRQRVVYGPLGVTLEWRDVCLEQARRLARHLKEEESYASFLVR